MAGRNESEEEQGGSFVLNGLEHFTKNPRKTLSMAAIVVFLWIVSNSISNYKRFGTEVDERIANHRQLNETLGAMKNEIGNIKDAQKEKFPLYDDMYFWYKAQEKRYR